jgi:hypothetical protein
MSTIRAEMSRDYGAGRLCRDLRALYLELVGWDPLYRSAKPESAVSSPGAVSAK